MEPFNSSFQLLANRSRLDSDQYQEGDHAKGGQEPYPVVLLLTTVIKIYGVGCLSLVGVVTNILSLVVFYRQGILTDSATTTLSALALSDFFVCFLSVWGSILLILDSHWDQNKNSKIWFLMNFYFMTGFRPKSMFTQITCWCTAYLALERFYSVVFPFTVKEVFSAKRSCVTLSCIFLGTFCLYIPNNFGSVPVWVNFYYYNVSVLTYKPERFFHQDWAIETHKYMNAIVLRTLSMVVVVFCNVTIFWKVTLSERFKKSATSTSAGISTAAGSGSEQTSSTTSPSHDVTEPTDRKTSGKQRNHKTTKEMTLLRMLMVICVLFILCYIPHSVVILSSFLDRYNPPPMAVENLLFAITNILEVINSSSNIFIYFNMNTRFRRELRSVLFNTK